MSSTATAPVLAARNPATGETIGTVAATPPEAIDELVGGVRRVQPMWALLRPADRARYMRRVAQAVITEFEELTVLLAREQGRPPAEVATLELLPAIDALLWIADEGGRVLNGGRVGVHRSLFPLKRARVRYEPFGVVGVIGAGSAPFVEPLEPDRRGAARRQRRRFQARAAGRARRRAHPAPARARRAARGARAHRARRPRDRPRARPLAGREGAVHRVSLDRS